LIGDAAVQVKATTFGGIVHGLMAAECLAEAISKNKSYTHICQKKVSRDLWLSLRIRKALNKMNARDYNRLIRIGCRKIRPEKCLKAMIGDLSFKVPCEAVGCRA